MNKLCMVSLEELSESSCTNGIGLCELLSASPSSGCARYLFIVRVEYCFDVVQVVVGSPPSLGVVIMMSSKRVGPSRGGTPTLTAVALTVRRAVGVSYVAEVDACSLSHDSPIRVKCKSCVSSEGRRK